MPDETDDHYTLTRLIFDYTQSILKHEVISSLKDTCHLLDPPPARIVIMTTKFPFGLN